jgi:hypothetical protein
LTTAKIELLKKELGRELGLKKCFQDAQVTQAVKQLTEIGQKESYGDFSFAYINNNKNHWIILSGQPPTILDIIPDCAPNKIIDLLAKTRS